MIETIEGHSAPQRVLIIKPSALGDVVSALPVLRGLRRTFPDAHIAWLVSRSCAPLIAGDRQVDEVVLFERRRFGAIWRSPSAAMALLGLLRDLRSRRFDWAIDLQGLLRSALFARATGAPLRAGFADAREGAGVFYTHRIRVEASHTVDRNVSLARQLGIDASGADMRLEVSGAGEAFADAFCRRTDVRRGEFLICAPATRWATKIYPMRHWRSVVGELSRDVPVVLIAAPDEREFTRRLGEEFSTGVIDMGGQTSVEEMVAMIAASGGVVCSDSAAKFIAPAVGVDCVARLGPTRNERTGPYLRGRPILADVPCQGCLRRRCKHISCMQLIDPAEVVSAARDILNGRPS